MSEPIAPLKIIKSEEGHKAALERISALMSAEPGTPEFDELEVLSTLVEAYEREKYPMPSDEPKKKTVFAVYTNSDLSEGRGREYVKCICETRTTAERLGRHGYVQGMHCPVYEIEVLDFGGKYLLPTSLITIIPPTEEDMRLDEISKRKALARAKALAAGLTDEEIKLLSASKDEDHDH